MLRPPPIKSFEEMRRAVRAVAERERREQFRARQPVKPFKHGPLPEPKALIINKPRGVQ